MRAFLILITFALSLSIAQASDYLSHESLAHINLNGLKILDEDNQDTLMYRFKKVSRPSRELNAFIQEQVGTQPISKVWALATASSFKNILVFVARTQYAQNFQLFIIFVNSSGSSFVLDYEILDASPESLVLENGPSDELLRYKAIGSGPLFP
jgi:hypothetical protein